MGAAPLFWQKRKVDTVLTKEINCCPTANTVVAAPVPQGKLAVLCMGWPVHSLREQGAAGQEEQEKG